MKPRIVLPTHLADAPFPVRAGRAAGLGVTRLRGADLQRPFHGVRTAAVGELDLVQRARSYQAWMPEYAFFCAITAALLLGVPLPVHRERSVPLHVAVPSSRPALRSRGIIGYRVHVEAFEICEVDGLRTSSPERLWCELGALLSLTDLVAAGDYLIWRRRPLTSLAQLQCAVDDYRGRRGRCALRLALTLLSDRSDSRPESILRVILVLAGFHGLNANLCVQTRGGHRYFLDLSFPAHRVLIEYQGDYHRGVQQFRDDMTRRARLEADGWFVMLVNADDLKDQKELLQRIRRVLSDHPPRPERW